jgi:PTS system nitrogen regulatory IIA component
MNLRARDAAEMFGISEKELHHWIHKRGIPARKVGARYRLNREELLEWATEHGVKLSPEAFGDGGRPESLPSIADAVAAGGIFHKVPGTDKRSVLEAVTARMAFPQESDRSLILDMLLAREDLGSTGMGDGIAIPHPRTPIVLNVNNPSVSVSFLEKPVDYGAIDGKPVHTLFTLISPTVRLHLHTLSRLAFMLHDPAVRATIDARADAETILAGMRRVEATLRPPPGGAA